VYKTIQPAEVIFITGQNKENLNHVFIRYTGSSSEATAILIRIEGQFQVIQRLSSSKLVLKGVWWLSVITGAAVLSYFRQGSLIATENRSVHAHAHGSR
jgi:hypothetical protein